MAALAEAAGTGKAAQSGPSDFLRTVLGKPVVVQLNSGVTYKGVLACLDGFMNIALEQTEEFVEGKLTNKFGDTFIRGNNIMYISNTTKKSTTK
jgi:U6 snRNA-associated Sm-like protein LSm6